ncbi:hypothetical protein J4727_05230 [Providencia rettgeri]|uniref:Uncharacterized protein n=1 Tax=Providencia rettgeri TaxID=587 RepID=A0A939SNZ7_PRORE|nr:hypothetical protein [Providencia rettgeri]
MNIGLPDMLEVNIPSIYLAGQQWNAVNFSYDLQRAEQLVSINSENLKVRYKSLLHSLGRSPLIICITTLVNPLVLKSMTLLRHKSI